MNADIERHHRRALEVPHVLFVDDEPAVLSGLRRALHAERHRWDLSFAGGGSSALAILAIRPCAVLASDYRMPAMDGAELHTAVRDRHPGTARVTAEPERRPCIRAERFGRARLVRDHHRLWEPEATT